MNRRGFFGKLAGAVTATQLPASRMTDELTAPNITDGTAWVHVNAGEMRAIDLDRLANDLRSNRRGVRTALLEALNRG